MRPCASLAVLLTAATCVSAADPPPKPATQPASPAAQAPPSYKEAREEEDKAVKSITPGAPTPQLLLRKVIDSWRSRDGKRYVSCLDQSDNDLRVMAKTWALTLETMGAQEDLDRMLQDKYGKDTPEADEILGIASHPKKPPLFMDRVVSSAEFMKVEVRGDHAVVHGLDTIGKIEMIKQKDVWVVDHSKATLAARANEEVLVQSLERKKMLLDTYRVGRQLINDCRTLDNFRTRFRAAAVRTLVQPMQEERKRN